MPDHPNRSTSRVANVLPITAVGALLVVTVLLGSCFTAAVASSSLGQLDALALRLRTTPPWQAGWQQAEQQRLCRLSALMRKLQTATSLPALHAELTWYAANQRPKYAAADMQQLLQAKARAAAAIDSTKVAQNSQMHYIGQIQIDHDHRSSSSDHQPEAEHPSDLFVMAPDGDGSMLLQRLSEDPHSYDSPMASSDSDAATPTDCYYMVTSSAAPASSQGKVSSTNQHHPLQQSEEVNAGLGVTAAATAQLTTADLLFAKETLPQPDIQQPSPAASRRLRRLVASDSSSADSAAEDSGWLLNGVHVTGLAGHDGKLVSIQNLPIWMPAEPVSLPEGDGGGPAVLPQVSSMSRGQQDYRIIGGVEAPKDRYKWVCSLRGNNDFHFCGCSLIAPSVVLTAAHCLDQVDPALSMPWVEIGRYYLTGANETTNSYDRIKCTKSIVNPGWSFDTGLNDVALCFLAGQSRFTPVTLVAEGDTPKDGTPVTVMGWGAQAEEGTTAPKLMEVEVNVTPLASCSKTYQGAIKETQICAGVPEGGKDACQGDSGGPLILPGKDADADVQVGIVSYGVGCGRPNTPGVYTDISKYRSYITEQLLANGISYPPVTGNGKALTSSTAATVTDPAVVATDSSGGSSSSSSDPQCACSSNGYSASTFIGQTLTGCKQHGLDFGDRSFYCYAVGGAHCAAATASSAYPGAAWISCDPQSQTKETSAPVSTPAATGSTTSTSASSEVDLSGLLQSLQSWITFNAASNSTGSTSTATANRAQAVAYGGTSSPKTAIISAIRHAATKTESGRQ